MGKIKEFSFLFLIGGLCFFLGSSSRSGSSAQQAPPLQKPLQHEVSVTLKLIQVYVTDKKGKAVQDLTKEDFIVRDNGRQMTLTEFEKHILEAAPQKPQAPAPEVKLAPTATPPARTASQEVRSPSVSFIRGETSLLGYHRRPRNWCLCLA